MQKGYKPKVLMEKMKEDPQMEFMGHKVWQARDPRMGITWMCNQICQEKIPPLM
jgi:hypothetical protein